MSIWKQFRIFTIILFIACMTIIPVWSLDLDSTVTDTGRSNYSGQSSTVQNTSVKTIDYVSGEAKQVTIDSLPKLPTVPALPKNVNSPTVAPYNGIYSGKIPNEDAITPCNFKVDKLVIDESVVKSKSKTTVAPKSNTKTATTTGKKSKTVLLPKGSQFRVVNKSKISDTLPEGSTIEFRSTQELKTPYYTIPKNTRFTAKVVDSHSPQITCNGGLVGLRMTSLTLNGYNIPINAGIIKFKTDNIYFSNLKGEHTYWKTTCKKAKWGQKMFTKWSKTSSKLASKGAGVIIAPFPYIGGCILAASSTLSSPVTAQLGKGGHLNIPQNVTFTIKLYDDAYVK